MNYTDFKAPGKKVDMQDQYLPPDSPPPNRDLSPNTTGNSSRQRRVSTAHIAWTFNNDNSNPHAQFAFDELVSACCGFLGCETVNETARQFAENIVTLIGSPTALDKAETKRRLEQLLPDSPHRDIHDQDCIRLCSLADRVLYPPPTHISHLHIVDDDADDTAVSPHPDSTHVHYLRPSSTLCAEQHTMGLPRQLPSFVERNVELGEGDENEYDQDITPYASDHEPPIQMI
ncbi:MAG: hypothetical protein EXX96DRAFT_610917 [Benjaminiella poitrasii]|nr:MAG: hypothetical protein EXX96DRAFT_610917 [Benjaminiella poitrasii]